MARQLPESEKKSLNILGQVIENGCFLGGHVNSQREADLILHCENLQKGKPEYEFRAELEKYRDYFSAEMVERPPVSLETFQEKLSGLVVPQGPVEFADQDRLPGVADIRPFSDVARELAEKAAMQLRDKLRKAPENVDRWIANPKMPSEKRKGELFRDLPGMIRDSEIELLKVFPPEISRAEDELASTLFREAART